MPCYYTAALSSSRGWVHAETPSQQTHPRPRSHPSLLLQPTAAEKLTFPSLQHPSCAWTNILRVFPCPGLILILILYSVQRYMLQNHTETASCFWINRLIEIRIDLWAGFVWVRTSEYGQYVLLLNTCRSCYIRLYTSYTHLWQILSIPCAVWGKKYLLCRSATVLPSTCPSVTPLYMLYIPLFRYFGIWKAMHPVHNLCTDLPELIHKEIS